MARRKKSGGGSDDPAWLVTFSDLMTLLLTFFVLLLSMAVIDEEAKRVVLGSVAKTFASGETLFNPLATQRKSSDVEPGAMTGARGDLTPIKDMVFDDANKDLNFQENKYVQILSINDAVLFRRGQTVLSPEGVELLDRLLPYFQQISYPLLVAGHTAVRRDEEGTGYRVTLARDTMDTTWLLSYRRAQAVYSHLTLRGMSPGRLSLEAFGQYHPRYSNNTPEGRQKNRRVDIVLDKRNLEWIRKVEELQREDPESTETFFKGFRFDLTLPDMGTGLKGVPQSPVHNPADRRGDGMAPSGGINGALPSNPQGPSFSGTIDSGGSTGIPPSGPAGGFSPGAQPLPPGASGSTGQPGLPGTGNGLPVPATGTEGR